MFGLIRWREKDLVIEYINAILDSELIYLLLYILAVPVVCDLVEHPELIEFRPILGF